MRFSGITKYALALLAITAISTHVRAQEVLATGDSRGTITDPGFYPVCSTLTANLSISSGEPSSETSFDTSRIQTALNACSAHHAVELKVSGGNNAFLIQPITIPSGYTLLIDGGVTVFASRNPADYQDTGSAETCGTIGTHGGACIPLITVNHGTGGGSGVEGYGIIDGRGGDDLIVGGVVSGASWWDTTDSSSTSRTQNKPVLVYAQDDTTQPANNFTLSHITLRNPPYFAVQWAGDNFTAWGVKITAPGTAPNTDGIDPRGTDVTIANSYISDGDDAIAVKADDAAANITVNNVNTYSGHGISIGSQTNGGLNNMLVENINQLGDGIVGVGGFGVRIKTDSDKGGLVQNVTFMNICSKNIESPMALNPNYGGRTGTSPPTFTNIIFKNIHVITNTGSGTFGSGKYQFDGYGTSNRATITFDNVNIVDDTHSQITPAVAYVNYTVAGGHVDSFFGSMTGTDTHKTTASGYPDGTPAYTCVTSQIPLMDGELYMQTSSANNLQTLSTPASGTVTLNAVVQTTQSQLTYTNYKPATYTGVAAPTAAVTFYDGATSLGSASIGGNGTLAALSVSLTGWTSGTHTITAQYNGDANYSAFTFGTTTIVIP